MTTAGKVDLAGDGFFVLVDLLEAAKAGLPDEVPSPLDDRFSEIARAYRKADPALRQQVREQIPIEYWLPLLQLGDRCAEWALVDKDPKHLEDGLTAYCLEDFRFDAHENLVHLSRLWYAGKTLHADTVGIFNQVGQCGSPHGLQELSNFSARPEEAKSPLEHGPREISGRGPHPLSPPRRQRVGVAGHVTVALLRITWRILRNEVSFAQALTCSSTSAHPSSPLSRESWPTVTARPRAPTAVAAAFRAGYRRLS